MGINLLLQPKQFIPSVLQISKQLSQYIPILYLNNLLKLVSVSCSQHDFIVIVLGFKSISSFAVINWHLYFHMYILFCMTLIVASIQSLNKFVLK
jgi:hypothetical protein